MIRKIPTAVLGALVSTYSLAESDNKAEQNAYIEQITITGKAIANNRPVATYGTPVSGLEYDPRVDLQSRNMAEAQADVTIRGGIFENTGFRIGSATLIDPQTGHYFAEIPIATEMLSAPNVLTGADNALYGVNSSVGTISQSWKKIETSGNAYLGTGDNSLDVQRLRGAVTMPVGDSNDWSIGFEGEYSHSESDGTIKNGDHDYDRISGRIQLAGPSSQTDLFMGEQKKFFGWPNMYTPFGVNETEDLKTLLVMLNHQQSYGQDNSFEVSAYFRRHNDHYVFSRENPAAFQAFHETEVKSLAVSGRHGLTDQVAINYSSQVMEDSIESTSLENNFTSRSYYKLSVLPEYLVALENNQQLRVRLGVAFDDTNRDDSETSFIGDISWKRFNADGSSDTVYLSYAEASQVSGYTAIGGSETGGLFRSNHDLERETTKNLEVGVSLERDTWDLDMALFHREDNDLTDWTYSFSSTSARSANPVDIDTTGFELIATKRLASAELISSYTYLDKSEDYGAANIDASFYALNYPDHRVTLGAIWRPFDQVEIRIDNEWRKQKDNALRNGDDEAVFTHLTALYMPQQLPELEFSLAVDNLWDESFEDIPGTPGRGKQFSAGVAYRW